MSRDVSVRVCMYIYDKRRQERGEEREEKGRGEKREEGGREGRIESE